MYRTAKKKQGMMPTYFVRLGLFVKGVHEVRSVQRERTLLAAGIQYRTCDITAYAIIAVEQPMRAAAAAAAAAASASATYVKHCSRMDLAEVGLLVAAYQVREKNIP